MLVVFFDETCGICKKIASAFAKLVSEHKVKYVPARDMPRYSNNSEALAQRYTDIHALEQEQFYQGYETYVQIAKRTPILTPFYFFLIIPLIRKIGVKIYRHIADSRTCIKKDPYVD